MFISIRKFLWISITIVFIIQSESESKSGISSNESSELISSGTDLYMIFGLSSEEWVLVEFTSPSLSSNH